MRLRRCPRGRAAEMRQTLRAALPTMLVHVELQANSSAEAEQDAIVERVKLSSGAFYDSGAAGTDQTVMAESDGAATTDLSARPKPRGGRKLVKKPSE